MESSNPELGALVRELVARQLGREWTSDDRDGACRAHPSHGLLSLVRGAGTGEACLIEPAVRCNHCGYCQSYGH